MTRAWVAVVFSLACFAGCDGGRSDPSHVAKQTQAIVHGTASNTDDAVVGVFAETTLVCTGVFLGGRVVLTAAHCLSQMPTQVFFGNGTQLGGRYVPIERSAPHPDYIPGTRARDVAALLLAEDVPEVAPMKLSAADMDESWIGRDIRLVGFGDSQRAASVIVRKRQGQSKINALDADLFRHEADPALACFGDSGGPALVQFDGGERVIGIATGGDDACESFGLHVRVDAARELIDAFPEPTRELGERCSVGASCTTGSCVEALTRGAFSYCSRPCASDADCSGGLACMVDRAGERLCRHDEPSLGGLAHACDAPEDCASSLCESSEIGGARACTLRCFSDNALACPAGFACEGVSGEQGHEACFLESPEVDSAICSVKTLTPNEASSWPAFVALVTLLLLVSRHRRRRSSKGQLGFATRA